jgi:pyocin large subunit-like protein
VVVHNKESGSTPRLNGRDMWGRPETLQDHFNRHGKDFGSRSPGEYAQQAADFLVDAQRRGLPTKIDGKGVIRVYDPETNTFASYNPNGTTATFFKPKRGIDYWNDPRRCPGVSPWSPGQ